MRVLKVMSPYPVQLSVNISVTASMSDKHRVMAVTTKILVDCLIKTIPSPEPFKQGPEIRQATNPRRRAFGIASGERSQDATNTCSADVRRHQLAAAALVLTPPTVTAEQQELRCWVSRERHKNAIKSTGPSSKLGDTGTRLDCSDARCDVGPDVSWAIRAVRDPALTRGYFGHDDAAMSKLQQSC
jgi:hypothetical protein